MLGLTDFSFVRETTRGLVALLRNAAAQHAPSVNVLMHNPPGTGKTALVDCAARALAGPLIVKRTSDLMRQHVGKTGQHIAAMRQESEAEKSVWRLPDKADRFLQDHPAAGANV